MTESISVVINFGAGLPGIKAWKEELIVDSLD